ncbi:hypothetical protein EWM64_g6951 [Hericium alpestre]|uniref:Uncharacterized protein n=1 Tax=Hericium alpestre TaxID=135208 RepID=A0A4Y9ZQL1_9AGAM|nr:hypothetical protein EWM64_g6951 [Hericium alpestre]
MSSAEDDHANGSVAASPDGADGAQGNGGFNDSPKQMSDIQGDADDTIGSQLDGSHDNISVHNGVAAETETDGEGDSETDDDMAEDADPAEEKEAEQAVDGGDGIENDESEEEKEEEEGEEDDDEDEDEDEDEEPALKYERLGGSVQDLFRKDSASALAISNKLLALGTHNGIVHILDLTGKRVKSFKPHTASITDICFDSTADFVGTASLDGQVVIYSLSTPENYVFNMKRPVRTVSLEPQFAKKSSRAFVCGGMAGSLVMHEKGWLGHKETILHSGEGPVWQVRWRGRLIAWANDMGVKIYDTLSQTRITFIDRQADSLRPDLFKCTLNWQDDSTLLIAWADVIKVARIRARSRSATSSATAGQPPLLVEITAVFQLDCMIADTSFLNEATEDRKQQKRKAAEPPELRIVSRGGEELATDVLSVSGYQSWGCNDYAIVEVDQDGEGGSRAYAVLSPKDIVIVRTRDRKDHIEWLVERRRYEEALDEIEKMEAGEVAVDIDATAIGQRYIEHLLQEGDFVKAAQLCPKVCGLNTKRWEDWIFVFAQKQQLQAIIPFVPIESPRLDHLVYEMILAYFLANDRQALQRTIKEWPHEIYDISAVIVAIQSELDRSSSSSSMSPSRATPDTAILMECLAELYTINRQPGKALPYFLRLRRPNVFDLIREHNLFASVQDQALLLVEFDHELMEKRKAEGEAGAVGRGAAIALLVDHTYSIPVARVVQQLQSRPFFLFQYLDALFERDPHLSSSFADMQVKLTAEYAPRRLIDFLRASHYYNLEAAYAICTERDYVSEMVFLLGRMGDNKKALYLIIDRMGDVSRAIDFAKEQNDDDLWEDLLKYSETRPPFIRGLLENVGAEIDPIRLIRRIKNGLEIPGLKAALIKILQEFNLQISLLEGCQAILHGDCSDLAKQLHHDQTSGFFMAVDSDVSGFSTSNNMQNHVWLDCDPGHDDAIAILLAIHLPNVNLLGVSTVHGNTDAEHTKSNAARCLYAFGAAADVRVYGGATRPLLRPIRHDPQIHGVDGLGGVEGLPSAEHPDVHARFLPKDGTGKIRAIDAIARAVRETWKNGAGSKVSLATCGPLTNAALFLSVYPDLMDGLEQIVMMGGAIGLGNRSATAEFNILCDPEAAQIVMNANIRKVMIPLNVTHQAIVTDIVHSRILANAADPAKASSHLRHTLSTLILFFKDAYRATFGFNDGPPIHDALTVAYISQPQLFTCKRYRVEVELQGTHTCGETVADIWGYQSCDETWGASGKNCLVALELNVRIHFTP